MELHPLSTLLCIFGALPCQQLLAPKSASIPQYVLDYAPVVYLHPEETFNPGPIADILKHAHPENNFTDIPFASSSLTLNSLATLNTYGGSNVSLSSTDDITQVPKWLHGSEPNSKDSRVPGSPSSAIITRDVGNGTLFAFYMLWYPFNYVPGFPIGYHVGDWEHFALRFDDSKPTQAWYSQHDGGRAYTYDAVEKDGQRPVVYSANGTHANYATQGTQGLVGQDVTKRGARWDPAASAYLVQFQPGDGAAHGRYLSYAPGQTGQDSDALAPTNWLYFLGRWGDAGLPPNSTGNKAMYVAGPTGPQDKNLGRSTICDKSDGCVISDSIH